MSFARGNSDEIDRANDARSEKEEQFKAGPSAENNVTRMEGRASRSKSKSTQDRPDVAENMNDIPSRDEIDAKLGAAEARTEARIAQLSSTVEIRSSELNHKIDLLVEKINSLVASVSEIKTETKTENKETRKAIWTVGIGALAIIIGLVTWLYNAGLNEQANLLAAFQSSLAVRGIGTPALAPGLGNGAATVGPSTQPAAPNPPEKK